MGNLKFEGDLTHIAEPQQKYIAKVLEELGYSHQTVVFSMLGKVGDNYMANVRRISIRHNNGKTFKMIAKIAVQDPVTRHLMNTGLAFKNEGLAYTVVFPKYTEMEEAANVPENQRFRYPKCYGVNFEEPMEVILLEDMTETGHEMLNKLDPLSDEIVKLVLDDLAHLHALSYAWKHEDSEAYDSLKAKLDTPWNHIGISEASTQFFGQLEQQVMAWLEDEEVKNQFKGLFTEMSTAIMERYKKDFNSKFSVIHHGDTWTNNFLMKMKDSAPTSCLLIDYQMIKSNKPASDLLYLFFTSTLHEQRVKHLKDWIKTYHNSLDKHLAPFGLKAAYVLPEERLELDIKEHADTALRLSLILTIMTLREASETLEMLNSEKGEDGLPLDNKDLMEVKVETLRRLQERARGMFDSMYEFGYVQGKK